MTRRNLAQQKRVESNMFHRRKMVIVAAMISCSVWSHAAFGEARSVQEFLAAKEKWDELIGTRWTIEGRYSGISERRMQLTNCPLPFRFKNPTVPPRSGSNVVEVTGTIEKEDDDLFFQVESLRSRPSDLDTIRTKRAGIETGDPQAWYRVAEWARQRGEFYKDEALLKEATDLNQNGVLTEYRQLTPMTVETLAAVLTTARSKQVDQRLIEEILHTQFLTRRSDLASQPFDAEAWQQLADAAIHQLRSAATPLVFFPRELAKRYQEDPRSVYTAADDSQRATLHRLYYLKIVTDLVQRDQQPDGSNGLQIAERLREVAPERTDLIESNEARAMEYQIAGVERMPRQQMLELAERLEQKGQPLRAREVKKKWLLAREPLLQAEGARGLADLGSQWLELLNDEQTAAKYYVQAWKENSQYVEASDWLKRHGYVLHESEWRLAATLPDLPKPAIDQAIEAGRIHVGMTGDQVRAALGAVPTRVSRFASNGKVTDLWIYQQHGILVRLSRPANDQNSRVDAVESLPERSKEAAGNP